MDERKQEQEDFGTKACNRCGVVFKRKNRYNFFCPGCARHNSNESIPKAGLGRFPARDGHGITTT